MGSIDHADLVVEEPTVEEVDWVGRPLGTEKFLLFLLRR